jgi:hypothetical protein
MANQKLLRLVELTAAFKEAVESRHGNDVALQQKVMQSVKPEEIAAAQDKMAGLQIEGLQLLMGGEPSDKFLGTTLELLDLGAEFTMRALPIEEMAACMPADLKNDEDIAELQKNNAPTLAKIAAFKA